jgi:hypothetical protein
MDSLSFNQSWAHLKLEREGAIHAMRLKTAEVV